MTAGKPREIALRVLRRRASERAFVEDLFEAELGGGALPPRDRALCQELVYGVARWQATLDWLIARKTDGRAQKSGLLLLLRLGLYQLFWLDRVPPHAAVNETVELAKRSGFGPQAGFLNAVLRGFLRERETTRQLLAELKVREPALGWSHPDWLCARWTARWGTEAATRLMEWNNTPPKTYARVNTLKTDAGQLLARWRQEDVEYDFCRRDWLDESLVFELKAHPPLAGLPSFRQGWFYLQDPSTLLAVRLLDPQPGETVLDLCAAPGGKTAFIAQLMQNQGRITAGDTAAGRLKLVTDNCARLGVANVETMLFPTPADANFSNPASAGSSRQFDRILVDAPCSNTGVMRRRVDLRWRIRLDEIGRLAAAQLELLRRAASRLKPGGTLVYSTCSLEPEENRGAVDCFLAERPEFILASERQLVPFADRVDGAYVACLRRR